MWMGSDQYRLAPALVELIHQLQATYPAQAWQTSPQTGTIGDAAHLAEGSASDHNPWLNRTVRALDVAANIPGGPDAEALFAMVNRMFADRDGRVWPNGYAIFNGRITDWDRPGEFHTQQGDPHLFHVHISVSQNPSGYESTAPWPLPGEAAATGISQPVQEGPFMALSDQQQADLVHQVGVTDANVKAIYAWSQSTLLRVASLGATVESQAASLTALQAAVTALSTAPPGSVDPAALTALRDAIHELPAEVRALFESQPLTIEGAAK